MVKKFIRLLCRNTFIKDFFYKLTSYIHFRKDLKNINLEIKNKPDTLFLVFTPEHGNLGDHAIALAEAELLQTLGINYIEIPHFFLYKLRDYKLLSFFKGKKILLHGGGYLGTLWFNEEKLVRQIIKKSKNAIIYSLPNTIFYDDSAFGRKEFEKSKKIYNNHKNLTFCAREETSYNLMMEAYENVKLIPDMVLFLDRSIPDVNRNGCLLCLRNDLEKTLSSDDEKSTLSQVQDIFGDNFQRTDMCVDHNIPSKNRKTELEAKFAQIRQAELVITDRLHGMIFCAITGTPCIVINSKSPKVKGCYKWIEHLEYIKFADNISDISDIYKTIPKKIFIYDNSHLQSYYDTLKSDIRNLLH